ncbi:MAG: hypothetical protein U0W65_13820 [Bacteroidia bacterium]
MKTKSNLKKLIAGLAIFVGSTVIAQEQIKPSINSYSYKNAIGLRAGETSGITFKHHFGNSLSFEGIASFWPYTFGATGLVEKNINIGAPGLNFYFGGGGHVNVGNARYRAYYLYSNGEYVYVKRTSEVAFGIDGIAGIEYKFKPVPIAISADLKPYIEINSTGYAYSTIDPSIGVKLTF